MLAFAENGDGAGGPDPSGDHLADLFGDGPLLAYDGWHICTELVPGNDPGGVVSSCPAQSTTGAPVQVVSKQTLWAVTNGHRAVARTGADATRLVAADAGRLAVVHGDAATVFTASGSTLRTFPIGGRPPPGLCRAACSCSPAAGSSRTYDVTTGALRKAVTVAATETLRDLQGSTAVLVRGRRVHALNVLTGASTTFLTPGSTPVDAQLEPAGIFYSYALPHAKAAVAFRPLSWVTSRLH